jgi:hypothetical protein
LAAIAAPTLVCIDRRILSQISRWPSIHLDRFDDLGLGRQSPRFSIGVTNVA